MSKAKCLVARVSEERILQLSNDLSEDIKSGTTAEWRAVALYFRSRFDLMWGALKGIQAETTSAFLRLDIQKLTEIQAKEYAKKK